jgi:hypothetical protein
MKNITDYLKVFKNINKQPRTMVAELTNMNTPDLEQSPDSFLKPGETLEDWDVSFRRPNAEGGRAGYNDGQLVTPSVDGSRPGYGGDDVVYKTDKWLKEPEFKKFYETQKNMTITQARKKYEVMLARKNKIVGLPELSKALGDDNPYSVKTLKNAWNSRGKKITKNMLKRDAALIKNGNKIIQMINDTLGEPTSLVSAYTKPGQIVKNPVWDLNPSKIKKLNKVLKKHYSRIGELRERTVESMFDFNKNNKLGKAIDSYTGGKINPGDSILEILAPEFKKTGRDPSHALMQYARALRGEIQMEGIDKNVKRGNKIIKMLSKNWKGPLGSGFLTWAKLQMGKHFDDPNADYRSLTRTLETAMREAGITGTTHIDEIFPARTGQLTIGKGSGAYNHIIQLIDGKINVGEKVKFDADASPRYRSIIKEMKAKKPNWDEVNRLVKEHDTAIKDFYETNPQAKGKVKLTKLNYDPVKKRFASPTEIYGKDVFPSKIQKDMDKFYRKTGLSLDVGSTMTLETTAKDLEKVAGDPKAQMKILQKLGYGKHCKATGGRVGFAEAGDVGAGQMKCIMSDVEKTRADMKSPNVEVRAKALTKQRKALQLAGKIPQFKKILKTGVQFGTAAITKPLEWLGLTSGLGYAIEGIVEGGFYDNARRKGYSHEQAMAETLTPGLIAGRPHDVPWYGGSEKLREKELYTQTDPREFVYFDGKEFKNPNFGKPTGKIDSKVLQYVDALHEQDRIYEAIGAKEQAKEEAALAETGFDAALLPGDLDAASEDVQDLARSGAYGRVDRTLDPESMASQAYNTAVEQQLGKDLQRKKEYLEKVDPGALEREEEILSRPRQLKKRYKEMEKYKDDRKEIFGFMSPKDWEKYQKTFPKYKNIAYEHPELLKFADYVETLESKPEGFDKTYKELFPTPASRYDWDLMGEIARAGGVANMAGGGIVGIRRPHAIPPERQGLRSIMINGKKY